MILQASKNLMINSRILIVVRFIGITSSYGIPVIVGVHKLTTNLPEPILSAHYLYRLWLNHQVPQVSLQF